MKMIKVSECALKALLELLLKTNDLERIVMNYVKTN